MSGLDEQARAADSAVRVFSVAIIATAPYSADEQKERCCLVVDRVRMPSDPRARI